MRFRTVMFVEADNVDEAAAKVANLLQTAGASSEDFQGVTTEGEDNFVLHFAKKN